MDDFCLLQSVEISSEHTMNNESETNPVETSYGSVISEFNDHTIIERQKSSKNNQKGDEYEIHKSCNGRTPNRSVCLDILNAVCIQTTTAGDFIRPGISRDGKISSLVAFSFSLAIIIAILFVSTCSEKLGINEKGIIFRVLLIFLLLVATLIYLTLICRRKQMSSDMTNFSSQMVKNVKIVFLSIFTVACITFHAMRISIHIVCPESSTIDNILRIVYDCEISLFYVFQLIFIVLYSQRIVCPSCLTHFGATVLAVTNAATFISHSTKAYFEEKGGHKKITDCLNKTITNEVYHSTKPFLDPTLLENALFAILFINDIFSSYKVRSGEDPATDQTLEESRALELSVNAQSPTKRPIQKWISIVCVTVGSVICSPYVVIRLIQSHYDHEQPFELYITQTVFFLIFKSLNYMSVIRCFYLLRVNGQQHIKSLTTSLNLSHYLILLSGFGAVIYFGLHLIASFVSSEKLYLMGNIMNMMATFVQTILILQMKDYKKINDKTKIFSISNMFLFLSITNLGLWVYATFIEAHFVYKQFDSFKFYGTETMLTVKNIVLPMCIFYRFKCFLAFLDLSGYCFSCICNKQTFKRGSYERM